MIEYGDQVVYLVSWLAVLKVLQLSVWPALRPLFGRLAYPAVYTVSLLLLLLVSFYLGLAELSTWLAIAPFLVLFGAGLAKGLYRPGCVGGRVEMGRRLSRLLPLRARAPVLQSVRLALLRAVHGPRLGHGDHAGAGCDTAGSVVRGGCSTSTTTWATGSWPSSG